MKVSELRVCKVGKMKLIVFHLEVGFIAKMSPQENYVELPKW